MSSTASNNQSIQLTEEQLSGLARLGDIGNRLGLLLDGPLAGPIASLTTQAGELSAQHDIPAITISLLEAADALYQAGWFALIRDQAEFVSNSLVTLTPLFKQLVEILETFPLEKTRADIEWLFEQLERGQTISSFVKEKWSNDLADYVVKGTEFAQREELVPTIQELVTLLAKLHHAGLYTKLGSIADYAGRLDEGVDTTLLVGQMTQKVPLKSLSQIKQVMEGVNDAIAVAQTRERELGGYKGLLHLLKDKDVQKGLRIMATLPAILSEKKGL